VREPVFDQRFPDIDENSGIISTLINYTGVLIKHVYTCVSRIHQPAAEA
jgi:hypothetical protein